MADNFHFVPSGKTLSLTNIDSKMTYRDRTRAAVVEVLDLWTSFTASFCPFALAEEESLGRHSQTLPQFPKPIYDRGGEGHFTCTDRW